MSILYLPLYKRFDERFIEAIQNSHYCLMYKLPYVLLIDDDADDCLAFTTICEQLEISAMAGPFENAKHLSDFIVSSPAPHVIFIELNMQAFSGKNCIHAIKKNEDWKSIPLVVCSIEQNDEVRECMTLGANRFIQKQNGWEDLKSVINITVREILLNKNGGLYKV